MKKYILFIAISAVLGRFVSFLLDTPQVQNFLANPEEKYDEVTWGRIIPFSSSIKGKLYKVNDNEILMASPTWAQLVDLHYCEDFNCTRNNKFILSDAISDIAIRNDDFDKSNEVVINTKSYQDVFKEYNLQYSGWKMWLTNHGKKDDINGGMFDILLIPNDDEKVFSCTAYMDLPRLWYRYRDIDVTGSKWYKENIPDKKGWSYTNSQYTSVWSTPEKIEFEGDKGEKLSVQLEISINSHPLFIIDDNYIDSEMISVNSEETDRYYNYEMEIPSDGKHTLTIINISASLSNDMIIKDEKLFPYIYIRAIKTFKLLNEGKALDTTLLREGDTIVEQFRCIDDSIYEKSEIYTGL